jgi:hypothetical protein
MAAGAGGAVTIGSDFFVPHDVTAAATATALDSRRIRDIESSNNH